MLTTEQLQAIRERVNKATLGPWYASHERRGEYVDSVGDVIAKCISDQCIDDTEFIAHAREDVPALLDEIERLGDALDKQIALSEELAKQRDEWKYKYITRPAERDAEIERLRGVLERITALKGDPEQQFYIGDVDDAIDIANQALAGESE